MTADHPHILPTSSTHTAPDTARGWQEAPLADALLSLARRDVTSFHALPLSHGDSLRDSRLRERYTALFGDPYLSADVSYSGAMLDSYFRPRGPLLRAQRLAAQAFGADHTLFLSGGTTTANRVALGALTRPGERVLADRSCHQSVHFTLPGLGAHVDYAPVRGCCERCPREFADVPALLRMYTEAHEAGRPYGTVVLSAASYDGVRYDLPAVLGTLAEVGADVRVVVDEAWGAAHHFHPELRRLTALDAFRVLRGAGAADRMEMAVTHSAHKSLSAPRQGSYLHLMDARTPTHSPTLRERAARELFQQHTTSPSWPVLAGLDLARAQASAEGERLLRRSVDLAHTITSEIDVDPGLSGYEVLDSDARMLENLLVADDPLRVMVSVRGLGLSASEFRRRLFDEHGVYIARECGDAVLLHVHIGVSEGAVQRLLEAMRTIQSTHRAATVFAEGEPSDRFIVAYPPGIPIALPGERLDASHRREIASLREKGSEIYSFPGRESSLSHLPSPSPSQAETD
ncbi:aminotransferase class I/II-fold pyridoxal phosphate-dependent enzyme [Streptomyces beihaiensis]|uniref:Aminotransferase class I/II-fold pyridoxal phosphate-dependent enzyme n=1 Tax=Streptomyces beihaiensis TaxID=2984495 RepID=A0ABT3TUJ3_9ACTN|nr:aminotransferase class I/II-fold pyridoxal phosphate-dependent enzyme [Streptomyces beihaiensis]MCX3060707.1 aminotransferase class I/II-fold pyridoxal phosphate-dependent enzyme [Streptomyces beihaiensis]